MVGGEGRSRVMVGGAGRCLADGDGRRSVLQLSVMAGGAGRYLADGDGRRSVLQLSVMVGGAGRCLADGDGRRSVLQLSVAVEEIEKLAEATGENEELKQRNADLQKLVNKFKAKGAGEYCMADFQWCNS